MVRKDSQNERGRRGYDPATSRGPVDGVRAVNAAKLAILITYLSICVKGKNHYCEPHPDTMIDLLKKYHGIEIGRRWFFQCTTDLEAAGYMRRQRRWIKLPGPEIRSDSSLWWFTIRGARFLCAKMIRGSQQLLQSMLSWIHRGDDRRPTSRDMADAGEIPDTAEQIRRIKALVRDIGSRPAGGNGPAPKG